jgi:hypothetical protein
MEEVDKTIEIMSKWIQKRMETKNGVFMIWEEVARMTELGYEQPRNPPMQTLQLQR